MHYKMVEESIRGLAPSSFEIRFPATAQHARQPRITMLNATLNYVEPHHKTRANSPGNTIQNQQQTPKHKQKSLALTLKNFFCTHT